MEEVDRFRVAAVLPAHPGLEVRAGTAPFTGSDVDEPSDTVDIEALERGDGEDALVEARREERGLDVVA